MILTIAGVQYPLRWGLRAQYRQQSLPSPSKFSDFADPARSFRASINFAWASLPASAPFGTPDALVDALDAEGPDASARLDVALAAAFEAASPSDPAKAEAKKASTDSSPAPASSSV